VKETKRPRQQKENNNNNNNNNNNKRNSNKQSIHARKNTLESKTDVALSVYTFLTKSMVHYRKFKLYSPNLSVISYIV